MKISRLATFPFASVAQRASSLALAFSLCVSAASAAPVHLRVDQRIDPLGIDSTHPTLLWQSDATTRNWSQSAYRILVASSPNALRDGHADVWDSGKQMSAESVNVAYAGTALTSHQRCYWAVQTWDAQGKEERSSEVAWWEMGLLQPSDWKAQWIRRDNREEAEVLKAISWIWLPEGDSERVPQGTEAEFRYNLHLDKLPSSASLHVLVGGIFTTQVNGTVTGHKDQWGAFDREDIRDQLHVGDNQIVVHIETPRSNESNRTFRAAFAAALKLTDGAGKTRWIESDDAWQARALKPVEDKEWSPAKKLGAFADLNFGVGTDRESRGQNPTVIESSTALLRKQFTPTRKVVSARLYVTALGSYQSYLNGKEVSKFRLTPGFTDYRKRVLYQTYDVTSLLVPGRNTVAAILGAGWHGSPLLWSGSRLFPGPDRLRAQLELTFADGTHQIIATDSSWETAASPIVSSEIYGGEAYDARLEVRGWNTTASPNSVNWSPVVVDDANTAILVTAQPDTPVQPAQTVAPIAVTMVGSGNAQDAVFDMGQNMVGVARLHVHGPRGTTVKLRFAERLNPDGTVYTENLRDADATDSYTLSGHGEEEWMPAFTFHGFRYVQVSGYGGKPSLSALQGQVLNSLPASPSIRFESSSALLNKMSELGLWGQRGNFVSIPTDCPQRDERMGWMGDAGAFWRTGTYNFDIDAFSHKFMLDVTDAQSPDGAFSNISPNLLQGRDGHPGAPGWGDAGVLVPYATWLQYGDATVIEQSWPDMERWMDFILRTNPTYLREKELGANFADWLAPDPHTPSDLVATAYWVIIARQMQTMATALGRSADAEKYATLISRIRDAYQQKYVHSDGSVEGDTQTSYVLTLYTGLAPKELEKPMTDRLVRDIQAHQTHLTTGFLGTPFLLSVLEAQRRSDVAYNLLLTTTYPSWGYMVDKGATTWWERWNGDTGDPSMNSYNHYAFGSVMAWVFRRVGGIDADPANPGFHHVLVSPHVEQGLSYMHTEYDSVYGTIVTDWTKKPDGLLQLNVKIPANTTATVFLPATPTSVAKQDGERITTPYKEGSIAREIGSGSYNFSVDSN
ncbi:alpha-L-rhamnosidase [Tunturibacter empetritectus]|uniref:alpha-L-rhamnosidase n=1 Tax=Tunturiibacter empetritectus TaxID=3069691 RepID=A0A7W8IHY0_9BACT|nr:alpha-L-rhamnosidase [Edaphobacter lichenicola]MBB5317478.1 alpha-L-rhamnosidase [Edaphobacter lichenicola]